MTLKFRNITIRDAKMSDAGLLTEWWNDGSIMAHAGFPDGLGTNIEKVKRGLSSPGRLIIEYDRNPIGEMSYEFFEKGKKALCSGYVVSDERGAAEIGIKLCVADLREKGIGRICLSMLISELFRRGVGEIILDTMENNSRARHVYELLGFERLRINKNVWTSPAGTAYSSVDYRLAPENFKDFTK